MILHSIHKTLIVAAFCHSGMLHAEVVVPELINEWGTAPNPFDTVERISGYHYTNDKAIEEIVQMDKETVLKAIKPRLNDKATPQTLKLLYAGILACFSDRDGQTYLIKSAENAKTASEVADTFWVIGHLERFYPYELQEKDPVDMSWAETFMLEMLSIGKQFEDKHQPGDLIERQAMAVNHSIGGFGTILAERKCPKLFPILEALWKQDDNWYNRSDIAWDFEVLEDKRATPLLMGVLESDISSLYRSAASALSAMHISDAVPILLKRLDEYDTYDSLQDFDDPRILPALKAALPNLEDYALGGAKMLIIDLETEDKLPRYIELHRDPEHKSMKNPLRAIEALKDPRSIAFAHKELHSSEDLLNRISAMRILGNFKENPTAIRSLIEAIQIDFHALADGKHVAVDNNNRCRKEISYHLRNMTGQDFGTDQEKWLNYFNETYPNP